MVSRRFSRSDFNCSALAWTASGHAVSGGRALRLCRRVLPCDSGLTADYDFTLSWDEDVANSGSE
ncbi:MAG: hypothetical protein LAP40_27745 [Acidobacteriia bacterium]|nr:hypothetical protein [Terriglobia bacterium]